MANYDAMQLTMSTVFSECDKLREAGQRGYAGGEDAFGNFNRLAKLPQIDRKKVLLTFMMRHVDGVFAFANGHKSQREDVRGRINDIIVYLCLLRGMIDEESLSEDLTERIDNITGMR